MSGESEDALAALERFVAENDDLLELEKQVGRFNVFDALRVARTEIRHSNFLAWLLDPGESHGQGDLFLKAVLMDVMRRAREQGRATPVSPVHLDGAELRGVVVRREWKNIDLLIACDDPPFVVAVENKVDSGESEGQLAKYEATVRDAYRDRRSLFVFLTPDGDDASDEDWIAYSYGDIHRTLSRVALRAAGSLGADVRTFLDHYLNLIGSRFMDDPQIQELCRRIYAQHRRAIDLINEHAGTSAEPIFSHFEEGLKRFPELVHLRGNAREWLVAPKAWLDILPPIGVLEEPRGWLVIRLGVRNNRCHIGVRATSVRDAETRNRIIAALVRPDAGLGLKTSFKNWANQNRLYLTIDTVAKWGEEDEPNPSEVGERALGMLADLLRRLEPLPRVLKDGGVL
jgi:hypothetical protein